jgi:site-specific recombinase XerD
MEFRFEDFIKSGVYLRAWSPKTVRTYRQGLNAFEQSLRQAGSRLRDLTFDSSNASTCNSVSRASDTIEPTRLPVSGGHLTKTQLDAFVIWMRQKGLSAGGCNMYIRTVNSYLSWLLEEGHIPQKLRIKLLPDPKRPLTTFSNAEVRLLLAYKPKGTYHTRTWTLILCLMDTGIRIDEALGLERSKVNLDALNITVLGKGNKERIVPISLEFRKHLFRWLQKTEGRYVFGARTGTRLTYRNSYRDIKNLCKRIGIEGEHVHPHSCRHYFAVNYIRNGGDIYRLSRILGHTSISTTQLYLRSMGVEHLLEAHSQFSPLAKLT